MTAAVLAIAACSTSQGRQSPGSAGHAASAVVGDRDQPQAGSGPSSADDPAAEPDETGDRPQAQPPANGKSRGEDGTTDDDGAPVAIPRDPLAAALLGNWRTGAGFGDCFADQSWYTFSDGGLLVNRTIDRNACAGDRLLDRISGHYSLVEGTLAISLDAVGSERPSDMLPVSVAITARSEHMTVAIGGQPARAGQPAETFLDTFAYTSCDFTSYEGSHTVELMTAAGETADTRKISIVLQLNRELPLVAGEQLIVSVEAQLSWLGAKDPDPLTDTIAFRYPATIRPLGNWRRIVPDELDGLSDQAALDAWNTLLDQHGVSAHADWAQSMLRANLVPSQRFSADDPSVLSSSLPDSGRWTKSDSPPPVL